MSELENPRSAGDAAAVTEPPSGSTARASRRHRLGHLHPPRARSRRPRRALRPGGGRTPAYRRHPTCTWRLGSTRRRCRIERPRLERAGTRRWLDTVAPAERHRAWPHAPPATHSEEGAVAASDAALVATTIPEDTERAETDGEPRRSGRGRRRSGRDRKGKSVGRYLVCVHVQPHAPRSPCSRPLARRALRLEGG